MNKIKIPINLKGLGNLVNTVKGKFSILLWVFLGLIIIFTGLVIFQEVRKVTSVQIDTSGILDRIVRVNLQQHGELENRLGENTSFQPWPVAGADAFGLAPAVGR